MATLLAITVLLPLVGSLVLVLLPGLEVHDSPADRPGVHAGHAGSLADFPPRFQSDVTTPQFAFMSSRTGITALPGSSARTSGSPWGSTAFRSGSFS